jgi:hypothetical protein
MLDDQKGTKRIPRSACLDYMVILVGKALNGLRGENYSTPSMLPINQINYFNLLECK